MGEGKRIAGLVLGAGAVYIVALGQIMEWFERGAWYFAGPMLALMAWSFWAFAQVEAALARAEKTLKRHGLKVGDSP